MCKLGHFRQNHNVGGEIGREYMTKTGHALKSPGLSDETKSESGQFIIPEIRRTERLDVPSEMERVALDTLRKGSNIIELETHNEGLHWKAKQPLDDTTTYTLLDTDPSEKLETRVNKILRSLHGMQRNGKAHAPMPRTLHNPADY